MIDRRQSLHGGDDSRGRGRIRPAKRTNSLVVIHYVYVPIDFVITIMNLPCTGSFGLGIYRKETHVKANTLEPEGSWRLLTLAGPHCIGACLGELSATSKVFFSDPT